MPYKLPFKFLPLICFICFFFFFLHVDSNVQTEELALLLKLKQYWQDPPLMSHWNNIASNTHYCSWPELTCIDGSVTELKLSFDIHQLSGTIPPFICGLKNITSINLSYNSLHGEFPRALYNCSKLTRLDLSSNSFNGPVPSDIHRMHNLQILDMANNMLTGNLPDSVFGLRNLRELDLSLNSLSGEIPEVTAAFNLTVIDLSMNNFEGKIPQGFGKLRKLSFISLMMNQLSGEIPNNIARLPALKRVLLNRNDFSSTLPPDLGQYSPLKEILLYSNRFTGGLTKNLCAKGNLVTLDASDNNLSGELFESLRNCNSLATLRINSNMFSGRIPEEISSWKKIEEFSANNNRLSGPIPEIIASLPSLGLIDLSENGISGPIPDQLGVHTYIYFINLSSNHLVGKVPRSFRESFLNNPDLSSSKLSSKVVISIVTVSVIAACFVVLFIYMLVPKLCRRKTKVLIKPTDLTWKFIPFHVLNFQESNILSGMTQGNVVDQGGSGKVYRVRVDDGTESFVAVKKICSNSKVDQNLEKQFLAEVDILGKIRHLNIVKLLCCVSSESSKLLVYEYMENRSLDWWLHGNGNTGGSSGSLVWPMRLKIAIGAAQGLYYMHHDCSPPIIHRDIKSGNILLDAEFNAKVADFGLAKLVVTAGEANTASAVAGSFGYIAPEYARTKRLNEKIDVYSYRVVLLELTTGRKANAGDEHTGLAQWAWRYMQEGNHIPDALDRDIRNSPDHVEQMVDMFKLGIFCTGMLPSARPSMKEVLQILQSFHLQN